MKKTNNYRYTDSPEILLEVVKTLIDYIKRTSNQLESAHGFEIKRLEALEIMLKNTEQNSNFESIKNSMKAEEEFLANIMKCVDELQDATKLASLLMFVKEVR